MARMTLLDLAKMPTKAIRENVRGLCKDFFYSTAPTVVPARDPGSGQPGVPAAPVLINIDGDSHFVVTAVTGSYWIDGTLLLCNPQLQAAPELQIYDQNLGTNMFDGNCRWFNVVGTAEHPMVWDPPYLVHARSSLNPQFFNLENIQIRVQLTLVGYKVYLQ